jgi:uncharacterized protein YndB with AHSA1/START domain
VTAPIHEPADAGRQTVVLERAFAAPRDLLFRLFTDPAHLVRWWVPYPLSFPVCEWDPRPGGALRLVLQLPDGTRIPCVGTFHEVVPPERVVFSTQGDLDEAGVPRIEMCQTVTFTERGGQTVVGVTIEVVKGGPTTAETLAGTEIGWMQDFGRLAFYLLSWTAPDAGPTPVVTMPSEREIVVTRTFDAPRAEIFAVLTDPTAIPRWWGPAALTTTVESMDLRPFGAWRVLRHRPDGETVGIRGEYLLIEPPELVATLSESDSTPGQSRIDAVHLFEQNGATRLTNISLFTTREERDRAFDSGLAREAVESYERLDHLLSVLV